MFSRQRHRAQREHRDLEPTRAQAPPFHGSVGRRDGGRLERAERADHQAEPHRCVGSDGARAVGDRGAVEREVHPPARLDLAPAPVLVEGRVLTEGAPEEIARNPKVREVYLGERGRP